MLTPSLTDSEMKNLVKEAFIELFEERRDLLSGVIAEALEGLGMGNAILEGVSTAPQGSISISEVKKANRHDDRQVKIDYGF
jgi:hypothetical protein